MILRQRKVAHTRNTKLNERMYQETARSMTRRTKSSTTCKENGCNACLKGKEKEKESESDGDVIVVNATGRL